MIKPILVPTNKQSIEIGDLTLPNYPNKINNGELDIAVRSFKRNDAYKAYDIILIDTEAKIVKSDLCSFDCGYAFGIHKYNDLDDIEHYSKIITSTNKFHNVPQLSSKSKLMLINYYNEHEYMPDSVYIDKRYLFNVGYFKKLVDTVDITIL